LYGPSVRLTLYSIQNTSRGDKTNYKNINIFVKIICSPETESHLPGCPTTLGASEYQSGATRRSKKRRANIWTLTEAQQVKLANAGWSGERIAGASALAEACAIADTTQQQKIQAYRAASIAAHEAETAVRKWYSQATRLSRSAIKQVDPADREQLKQLLGL
jgi:hypothetical protein